MPLSLHRLVLSSRPDSSSPWINSTGQRQLSSEEREQLQALIRKGKSPAKRLLKARILLKADVSDAGEGWSDSRIIKALESMVYRVRKQLVEEGFEAVLSRKPARRRPCRRFSTARRKLS
jgi:hypothetical protein